MGEAWICGRCRQPIVTEKERETCWYCLGNLCGGCWDRTGHCGHPEADSVNEQSKNLDWVGRHALIVAATEGRN